MIVAGPDFRVPPQLGILQLVFIVLAIQAIESDQMEYGEQLVTLTSWYRDPGRNLEVGGKANSLHPAGLALDFTSSEIGGSGTQLINGLACGVGSLFGLCRTRPPFSKVRAFQRIAPPVTQALQEADHFHYELDLG